MFEEVVYVSAVDAYLRLQGEALGMRIRQV